MPAPESPLHIAHQHAANAEDFLSEGLLIPAVEEHIKAANAFLKCEEKSSDSNTKRTLHMLYNEHTKSGKDLERRIAKLREENKDPTLPQKVSPRNVGVHARRSAPDPSNIPHASHPTPIPTPHRGAPMGLMDSQNNVDESFMVLGQRSDPGDAFNHFWGIMEGMLDNLSQPVAFTMAPLGTERNLTSKKRFQRNGSSSSDTDHEEPFVSKVSRKLGFDGGAKKEDTMLEDSDQEVLIDEGGDLSESFCLVHSGAEPSTSALKRENASLKQEMEAMQSRLATAERRLQMRKDQDQLLRDSIVMARHQAQRAMGASFISQRPGGQQPTVDLTALNINIPTVPAPMAALTAGRDREAQLLRRIRDLEEELRTVRTENDKQKVMVARFRERWEKLKESAKRKKDAKAAAEAVKRGVRECIEEEPEAEQELDDAGAGTNNLLG
ncbi:hypothetical protein PAXRUDRAFT_828896 [Paxillus rubicundulus Ve08.2h10]|uniref:Uncharacterized protein n=1 Tax=Paxillus rubicundulus Ve08.2h10 TaxID=930991 RepID=A0A0D0E0R6_9AGAM|nr:hypothetical protein PAXRUDRAFT_828896 [Paxillus rubicundulus Ve08.2h10]